jgi:hypothetical protein
MKTIDMWMGSPKTPFITVSITTPGMEDLWTKKRVSIKEIREEFTV